MTRAPLASAPARIVDGDGHVCEPPDLWQERLPARLRAQGIRLRWNEATGFDEATCEDWALNVRGLAGLGNAGGNNVELGRGIRYVDLNPAGFEPRERLRVMDEEEIDVAVLYPGLGFSLGAIRDPELAVASCRVYNDWLAEFCATDPRRLVGAAALPLQDPQAAVQEVARAAKLGLRGSFVRPNPHAGRPIHDEAFFPVWQALADHDMPLGFHPAGRSELDGAARGMGAWMAPGTHHALILLFDCYTTLSNFVYAGVLERIPALKVVMLESGGGWIAHWLDRMDEFLTAYAWQLGHLSLRPSEYFLRQGWISFDPGERTMGVMTRFIGERRMIWASDFPHSDARYPGVVKELRENTEDMPADARARLFGTNALELYGIRA